MKRILTAVSLLALLAACDEYEPLFGDDTDTATDTATDGETVDPDETVEDIEGDGITAIPPGTSDPTASAGIERNEARNSTNGGGLVTDVSYDPVNDTFMVDNLAFDGANVYNRGVAVSQVNGYAVFDAVDSVPDLADQDLVDQLDLYRAIIGVSPVTVDGAPRTTFAIVRTGGYIPYGFGGFVYERNGGVVLPTTGQATFRGDYAGVRVFDRTGGLEFTSADIVVDFDFEDFNANTGVKGFLYNRLRFAPDGTSLPQFVAGTSNEVLPTLPFIIQEGGITLTTNGEFSGELGNTRVDEDGVVLEYEVGQYYGILAGDTTTLNDLGEDGGELVGILVFESDDIERIESGIRVQETGGFILQR